MDKSGEISVAPFYPLHFFIFSFLFSSPFLFLIFLLSPPYLFPHGPLSFNVLSALPLGKLACPARSRHPAPSEGHLPPRRPSAPVLSAWPRQPAAPTRPHVAPSPRRAPSGPGVSTHGSCPCHPVVLFNGLGAPSSSPTASPSSKLLSRPYPKCHHLRLPVQRLHPVRCRCLSAPWRGILERVAHVDLGAE